MTTITLDANLDTQVQSVAKQARASVDEIVNDILAKYFKGQTESVNDKSLAEAYRSMSADTEREKEALEWCNSLIGDVASEKTR